MANIELKDRGSRKHLLDLLESDFRSQVNALIARSGFRLADEPRFQPYGRQNTDAWSEFEIEEYLDDPMRRISGLPPIAANWWLAHKTRNNSRPTWDLIGHLTSEDNGAGILLVEAKAKVTELNPKKGMSQSTGSPKSNANETQIKKRIEETQRSLNKLNRSRIALPFDTHFQLVNRLAYSCHLASLGCNVVLLYLGFCKDTYFSDHIVDERHWQRVMGAYIDGVVSQSFPETLYSVDGGGTLQMLIESVAVSSISTLGRQ